MKSIASEFPIDVVKYIFNFTPNYILRGNQVIQINKLTEEKYQPLRKMFRTSNMKRNVVDGSWLKSVRAVYLSTENGRQFYSLQCLRDNYSAHVLCDRNENENGSFMVYYRE